MSDPREDQEPDVDPDAALTDVDGLWRNVPRPTTEELLTPSSHFADPPSIPRAVKVIGLLIVALLLLLSIWLGFSLGQPATPGPAPTATAEEAPCVLEAPTTVGKYVRGDVKETPRESDGERDLLSATYTDGTETFVLLLSCPETEMSSYMRNAGVEKVEPVEGSDGISCGSSIDTAAPLRVCARIENEKATAVAGLSEQSTPSLVALLDELREESQ